MLEGLEICEVPFSRVIGNDIVRMESEFYNSNTVSYKNTVKASQIIDFSQYGTSKELNEMGEGYPVLRLNEFNYSFISHPDKYCSLLDIDAYHGLQLKKDDVLICRTNGNPKFVGRSAIVPKDYDYAFASYLFRIRPNRKYINSATLVAFLNSKYGRLEIEKYSMVGNQANFSPAKFREISIPVFSKDLNDKIEDITYRAFQKLEMSESLYSEAAHNMLECIDLYDFTARANYCSVMTLKESFIETGRLDAEYYQPKYDSLFEKLKDFPTATIKEIATIQKSIEPGSDAYQEEGIPFIRVANLSKFGLSNSDVKLDTTQFADTIRPQKDTILLSKDGSVGIAYKMEETQDVITSSAILHLQLTTPNVLPDYLTLVLNSIVVKLQAGRDAGGSIIQHWKPSEIEHVIIPILPMNEQQMIANKIKQSFKMRKDAQDLLLQAKCIIETAIEK